MFSQKTNKMFQKSVKKKVISIVFCDTNALVILVNCLDCGLAINPDRFVKYSIGKTMAKIQNKPQVKSAVKYFRIMENKIVRQYKQADKIAHS